MNGTKVPPTAPEAPAEEPTERHRRFTWGKLGAGVAILSTVGLWGYAFLWPQPVFGRLDDKTFPTAAEPVCAAAAERVKALPRADEQANDHVARAATVVTANGIVAQMIVDLETLPRGDEKAARSVQEWLEDYRHHLDNRVDYANRLAADRDARYYGDKSTRDQRNITDAVDRFADINKMLSCMTFDDVA